MDPGKVSAAVKSFARHHRMILNDLGNRQTQLLEIGANVAVVQHYRAKGYTTTIHNPAGASEFRVKLGTRGHPADYSRVHCERNGVTCEIHSNLSVESGRRDHGVYCVDVAVVKEGFVPRRKTKIAPAALTNQHLISFAEAKKLVIYPMLLAHFIGIVHEVTPHFMTSYKRSEVPDDHLPPTLITLGALTKNGKVIKESFERRKYKVCIADSFDFRLSYARRALTMSPFISLEQLRSAVQGLESEDEGDNPPDFAGLQIEDDELDEVAQV